MTHLLQPYEVALANNDLSSTETLIDIFYALDRLNDTITDVFQHIDKKVADERKRLTQINERVTNCQGKVQYVRGSNKATTVFSTAKFPAPKELPSYSTLFSSSSELQSQFRDIEEGIKYLPSDPKKSIVGGSNELKSEIEVITARLNSYNTDLERVEFIMEDKGIGELPALVQTVGSMLLYNSNINPYKEYQQLDNLLSSGRAFTGDGEKSKTLASAPSTLISGDALPDIAGLDLNYRPEMGVMAGLALPTNLPLNFLAADISFEGVSLPSIAPSANQRKADFLLPQITDGYAANPSAKQTKDSHAPKPTNDLPPPPPPPPPSGGQPTTAAPNPPPPVIQPPIAPPPVQQAPPPVVVSAPPPAPPQVVNNSNDDDNGDSGGASGGAPSFLDAIKGMSVAKLKSKEEAKVADAKIKREEVKAKPISMMDEMRLRMQRRNNAISGKDDKESKRRDSMIVQAAQNKPPEDLKPKLTSFGFKEVDNDSDDNKPTSKAPFASNNNNKNDNDSVSSDDSDNVSEISFDDQPVKKVEPPVIKKVSAPAPVVIPPKVNTSNPTHRGSLLDADNTKVAGMLNFAKDKKENSGSDSDSSASDGDWD